MQKLNKKMSDQTKLHPKLIIFDLDGTLADTVGSITEAMDKALGELGLPTRDEAFIRRAVGNGARILCRRVLPEEQRDDAAVDRLLAIYNGTYGETYMHVHELYAGMIDALRTLHERGYLLAVFSNKQDAYVKELCAALLPDGWFSAAEGQREGRPIKPDPATALEICARLGVSPADAVMVGDGETDVELSLRGGLTPVSATWGFRSREQLEAAGGKIFVSSPSDLPDIFE